jgi:hypothetical protein
MGKLILGNISTSSVKFGTADAKVYLGTNLVYPLYKAKIKLSSNETVYVPYDGSSSLITRTEVADAVSSQTFTGITEIEILFPTTEIASGAFGDATMCSALTISNSVRIIGSGAFAGLRVDNIVVPDGVTKMHSGAFADSRSMKTAVIGSGVTEVGGTLFGSSYNVNTVESITFKSVVPPTPTADDTFLEYTDDCPIYVPSGSVNDYKTAWYNYEQRIQAIPSGHNAADAAIKD